MSAPILPPISGNLSNDLQGVWWLLSREDWTKEGERRIDPILGADPIGILAFSATHFTAQFMKRERTEADIIDNQISTTGKNNTVAFGGYDAYFGTYKVDEAAGMTAHTLLGSVNPRNVGITVNRSMRVHEGKLMIQLDTSTPSGESVVRTLIWGRLSLN